MLPFFRDGQTGSFLPNWSESFVKLHLAGIGHLPPPQVRRGQITGKWQHPQREFNDLQIRLTSRSAPKSFLFHFNRELLVGLSYAQFLSGSWQKRGPISGYFERLSTLPGGALRKERNVNCHAQKKVARQVRPHAARTWSTQRGRPDWPILRCLIAGELA